MDATECEYKKPASLASEKMDEGRGIRQSNHPLYKVVQKSVLHRTLFMIPDNSNSVSAFVADPSSGYVAFPRYSEKTEDTDSVIYAIIEHNQ